jgi:GT2 family glycosyltransferase
MPSFNPIIMPVRNNLPLTRKALKSCQAQDIAGGADIFIIDNASTDGTAQFLQIQRGDIAHIHFDPPLSVAESWNAMLNFVFNAGAEYAFVVNNDIELHPSSYQYLVEDGGGFITLVGVRQWPEHFDLPPDPQKKRPHPDFSAYLIRKWVWDKVGKFDEGFKIAYCEDADYDLRMYKAGIRACCLDFPYIHHGAMTIKNAELSEVRKIQAQAERNREYFKKKWGFAVGSEEYYRAMDKGSPGPQA